MNIIKQLPISFLFFLFTSCSNSEEKIDSCKYLISNKTEYVIFNIVNELNDRNENIKIMNLEYKINDTTINYTSDYQLTLNLVKLIKPKVFNFYKCTETELIELDIQTISSLADYKEIKGGFEFRISDFKILKNCEDIALNFIDMYNNKKINVDNLINLINPEILVQNEKSDVVKVLHQTKNGLGEFIKFDIYDYETIQFDNDEFGLGYKIIYKAKFSKIPELRLVEFYYLLNTKNELLFNGMNILPGES